MKEEKPMVGLRKYLTGAGFFCVFLFIGETYGHEWKAPKAMADQKNPVALSSTRIAQGKRLYVYLCTHCHGTTMEGLSAEKTGLSKSTPNLKKGLRMHSDGDFFWKIKQGKGEMPSFKDELADEEIWSILHYLRNTSQ